MTNLFSRILLGAVFVLMLVGGGEALLLRHSYKANQEQALQLSTALTNAATYKASDEATQAAYASLQVQLTKLQASYSAQQKKLSDALNANKAWANTDVPDAVFDSIYGDNNEKP